MRPCRLPDAILPPTSVWSCGGIATHVYGVALQKNPSGTDLDGASRPEGQRAGIARCKMGGRACLRRFAPALRCPCFACVPAQAFLAWAFAGTTVHWTVVFIRLTLLRLKGQGNPSVDFPFAGRKVHWTFRNSPTHPSESRSLFPMRLYLLRPWSRTRPRYDSRQEMGATFLQSCVCQTISLGFEVLPNRVTNRTYLCVELLELCTKVGATACTSLKH